MRRNSNVPNNMLYVFKMEANAKDQETKVRDLDRRYDVRRFFC